jgi:cold-inducible RNA-binding protein
MRHRGNSKLYISNLSFEATEEHVHNFFCAYGEVKDVKIVIDRYTGRPRGFAFVEMGTPEAAECAKKSLDGQQFLGRDVAVDWARAREPSQPGEIRGGDYQMSGLGFPPKSRW